MTTDHSANLETSKNEPPHFPTLREAIRYWFQLGCISFGGPAGQIALMHKELVGQRRWISEEHFLQALNFCMLLPGPEAQQLATYLGWRLHGARGGLAAGILFVLPSAVILLALSWLYMVGGQNQWLAGLFYGLSAIVIAVVAEAVIRLGKKALHTLPYWILALGAFVAIFFFKISFVWIILTAALVGFFGQKWAPTLFPAGGGHGSKKAAEPVRSLDLPALTAPTWGRAARILGIGLVLWWVPVIALGLALGWHSTPAQQGIFFSQSAMVTFGGAYAVLPYVAQRAVERYGWLDHGQMMTGLGLAETTPGPLIMVLQFVGFVGGWQHPGTLSPAVGALIGAFITTWVTFVPCFIMIFLGGPYVDKIRQQPRLSAALTAITAAVVGVILNLALKVAQHTFFPEPKGTFDGFAIALAVIGFVALVWGKVRLMIILACGAGLGLLWKAVLQPWLFAS
jgi:chromate transporter